jgi:hypothetical protein
MNDVDYRSTLECLRIAARLIMPLDLDGFLKRIESRVVELAFERRESVRLTLSDDILADEDLVQPSSVRAHRDLRSQTGATEGVFVCGSARSRPTVLAQHVVEIVS